ncbi:MAG: hypothetical protein AAFX40_00675 [Cyanobacteria bacterium J06639_1]
MLRTETGMDEQWCGVRSMRSERFWQLRLTQRTLAAVALGAGIGAIASCGSQTSTLTTSPPNTTTQAVSAAGEEGDRASLIFQGDANSITAADIALVLAKSYLPVDPSEAMLQEAAGNLLVPTELLRSLDPLPTNTNANFAEVTGEPADLITLEDAAVVQAALGRQRGDRSPENLAADVERLLNLVGLTVRAVPGEALPGPIVATLDVGNAQLIEGRLEDDDRDNPTRPGSKSDDYLLGNVPLTSAVRVDLNSVDFDARIQVLDAGNQSLLSNIEDGGAVNSAQLVFIPEADRSYVIRATGGSGELGDYALRAFPLDAPILALSPTTPFLGQLDASDDRFGGDRFADYVRIAPAAEERVITLDLEALSSNLDLQLQAIVGNTGEVEAEDNNTRGNARLTFTAAPNITYLLRITSNTPQTGSYRLSAQAVESPPAPDIINVSSSLINDVLSFEVTFAEAIDPWSTSATSGNPIAGILYFDIDQTPATGELIAGDLLGSDASIDLTTQADFINSVELVNFESNLTQALVPIAFTENSFRIELQLSDLSAIIGRPENGIVNYRFDILNLQSKGDIVPDQGVGTAPELLDDPADDIIDLTGMAAATRVRLQQVPSFQSANPAVDSGTP